MRLHRARAVIGLAAVFSALAPAVAQAVTTVTITGSAPNQTLVLTAAAGDTNNILITQSGTQLTIRELGGVLVTEAIAECMPGADTNIVVCDDPDIKRISANLGNQDDRIENNSNVPAGSIQGGDGADRLLGSPGDDQTMLGGAGDDFIDGRGGPDGRLTGLNGDADNDTVIGGSDDDRLFGGAGTDSLVGGTGNDFMQGGAGGLISDSTFDRLDGGAGDDEVLLVPTEGDDVIDGGPDIDLVRAQLFLPPALAGHFTLGDGLANDGFGTQAAQLLGFENLTMTDAFNPATFAEEGGDDVIRGDASNNVIRTAAGNDNVDALTGSDLIELAAGNDTVEARDGFRDRIDCSAGTDTARVDQLDVIADCESVTVSFVQPFGTTAAGPPSTSAQTLPGCGTGRTLLTLGTGPDVRNGTAGPDLIFAGTGNDVIDALAGDDCVDLGTGNDRGRGGLGDDLIVGGLGEDSIVGGTGADRLRGDGGDDRLSGNVGNDELLGGTGGDRLVGGLGNDRLHGEAGKDSILGSSGRDRINGGAAADRLSGGGGVDVIRGDAGNDRLSGGRSRDSLLGNSGDDRINALDGARDRISCGTGNDRVVADRIDRVAGNCETIRRGR